MLNTNLENHPSLDPIPRKKSLDIGKNRTPPSDSFVPKGNPHLRDLPKSKTSLFKFTDIPKRKIPLPNSDKQDSDEPQKIPKLSKAIDTQAILTANKFDRGNPSFARATRASRQLLETVAKQDQIRAQNKNPIVGEVARNIIVKAQPNRAVVMDDLMSAYKPLVGMELLEKIDKNPPKAAYVYNKIQYSEKSIRIYDRKGIGERILQDFSKPTNENIRYFKRVLDTVIEQKHGRMEKFISNERILSEISKQEKKLPLNSEKLTELLHDPLSKVSKYNTKIPSKYDRLLLECQKDQGLASKTTSKSSEIGEAKPDKAKLPLSSAKASSQTKFTVIQQKVASAASQGDAAKVVSQSTEHPSVSHESHDAAEDGASQGLQTKASTSTEMREPNSSQKPNRPALAEVERSQQAADSNVTAKDKAPLEAEDKRAVSEESLDAKTAQAVQELENYLSGKSNKLNGEQKFLARLWAAFAKGLNGEKTLQAGEQPHFPIKVDVPALLANLSKVGDTTNLFSKAIESIIDFHVQTLFENGNNQLMMLGKLRYQQEGFSRPREANFVQIRVSKLEATQLGIKPGQNLSVDQLHQLFGDRVHFIAMVDRNITLAQAETKLQEGHLKMAQTQEEAWLSCREGKPGENSLFGELEKKKRKFRDEAFTPPWGFFYHTLGLGKIIEEIKHFSSRVLYVGMGSAIAGIIVLLILKLSEN